MPDQGTTSGPQPDLARSARQLELALQDFQRALAAAPASLQPAGPVFQALRNWRTDQARTQGLPPYLIASDAVLRAIEHARPADLEQLQGIRGIGPAKAALYGADILKVVAAACPPG